MSLQYAENIIHHRHHLCCASFSTFDIGLISRLTFIRSCWLY